MGHNCQPMEERTQVSTLPPSETPQRERLTDQKHGLAEKQIYSPKHFEVTAHALGVQQNFSGLSWVSGHVGGGEGNKH